MMIKLKDMYSKISEQTCKLMDDDLKGMEKREELEKAEAVAKISKQAINVAHLILKADKLSQRHDRIDEIVG